MFRLILCLIIVLSSSYIGYIKSRALLDRKKLLQIFTSEFNACITKLSYSSQTLTEIFNSGQLEYSFSEDSSFYDQWLEMLCKYKNRLKRDDILLLEEFALVLGATDTQSQIQHINLYIDLLSKNIEDAENDIATKSRLYRIFGFSIGTVISILII